MCVHKDTRVFLRREISVRPSGAFPFFLVFPPTSRAYSDYPPALIAYAKNGRKGGGKREFAQKPHTHSHIKWQKIWNFLLLLVLCLSLHRKLDCLSLLNLLKLGGEEGGFFSILFSKVTGAHFPIFRAQKNLAECAEMYFSHKNKKKRASRTCHSIIHHPSFLFHFHFFPFCGRARYRTRICGKRQTHIACLFSPPPPPPPPPG